MGNGAEPADRKPPSEPVGRAGRPSAAEAGVVVRPARPTDVPSFLEMFRDVVAEGRWVRTDEVWRSAREYRKSFRRSWTEDRASLVALCDGRVIGHLGITRESHPVTRHVASLGMAVAADWRGRGVGRALMAEAVDWARRMGVEKLALSVYPHNVAALGLYRAFGFREEGVLTGQSKKASGYLDEVVMGLWLIDRPEAGS